jgi:hypothetical protein
MVSLKHVGLLTGPHDERASDERWRSHQLEPKTTPPGSLKMEGRQGSREEQEAAAEGDSRESERHLMPLCPHEVEHRLFERSPSLLNLR